MEAEIEKNLACKYSTIGLPLVITDSQIRESTEGIGREHKQHQNKSHKKTQKKNLNHD